MKALLVHLDRSALAEVAEYLIYLGGVLLAIALLVSDGR